MLHLRLITPSDRTDAVARLIEDTVGTPHLVVLPGAARDPAGDLVLCDVAREAGDELLHEIRALKIDQDGSIAGENIDFSLSKRADAAEEEALDYARTMWRTINKVNLLENVAPTRGRATLVLRKGPEHKVQRLSLRKL